MKKNDKRFSVAPLIFMSIYTFFINVSSVMAIEKIEGGDITLSSLEKIIKDLAVQFQVLGIVVAFISMVIFTIQLILGDDETKQRRKKTILYTLGGVILLILIPSILNFIIDKLK